MDDVLALLRLQMEWGADEALDAEPVDRLRPIAAEPAELGPVAVRAATKPPMADQPRGAPSERAAAVAANAADLEALHAAISAFDGCALRDTASNLVWAEGNAESTILIIGEPPGREEDRSGHPFAGGEGGLLEQMLASIDLRREDLMLAPLLPWRPPGGRPPNATELAICLPFLHRLIVLVCSERLVLFGGTAVRALLPPAQARRRQAPAWTDCEIPGREKLMPALCLPSLAELQKSPALRRTAWAGLRLMRRAIGTGLT